MTLNFWHLACFIFLQERDLKESQKINCATPRSLSMSATRDRSSGIAFSNTNVYLLYKKSKAANPMAPTAEALEKAQTSKVIRAEELGNMKITKFNPQSLGRVSMASEFKAEPVVANQAKSLEDLKSNLNKLQDLHSRLRFMLGELEDLVKKKG